MGKSASKPSSLLLPATVQPGEIPHDAWVSAEQAEGALGHSQANTLDEEPLELIDEKKRSSVAMSTQATSIMIAFSGRQ